ncbi:MAG: hypothetical protein A3F10_05855 [Coxiella sp. RIFCSPHIGHO2_12_FULL_42_15]|nr:MAG: hypothetical protein A3F10_05855 [Coxiella sp. RIFCSPHIGHO2_12_FULL_42_15]
MNLLSKLSLAAGLLALVSSGAVLASGEKGLVDNYAANGTFHSSMQSTIAQVTAITGDVFSPSVQLVGNTYTLAFSYPVGIPSSSGEIDFTVNQMNVAQAKSCAYVVKIDASQQTMTFSQDKLHSSATCALLGDNVVSLSSYTLPTISLD